MDRRCGRTEPDPCSGLCDADVLRASQLQHAVQHVGRDGHLGRLSPRRLRTKPIANDALPARNVGSSVSETVGGTVASLLLLLQLVFSLLSLVQTTPNISRLFWES